MGVVYISFTVNGIKTEHELTYDSPSEIQKKLDDLIQEQNKKLNIYIQNKY